MRGGGLTDFHIGRSGSAAHAGNPHVLFAGERYVHLASAMKYDKGDKAESKSDFSKKEHREKGGKRGPEDGSTTGDNSSSDEEKSGGKPMARKKKKGDTSGKNGFPAPGSDGDGDGKKGEGKKKMDWSDKNRNGKPDGMEKKK